MTQLLSRRPYLRWSVILLVPHLPLWCLVAAGLVDAATALACTGTGLILSALLMRTTVPAPPETPRAVPEVSDDGSTLSMEGLATMSGLVLSPHGGCGTVIALDLGQCGVEGEAMERLIASLRMSLRRSDLVARLGASRVVMLLPGLSEVDARAVALRLRMALSRRAPLLGAAAPIPLGIATLLGGESVMSAAARAGVRADDERASMAMDEAAAARA